MDALKSRSFASHLLINHSMIHHILINVCERLFDELVKVIMISSLRYRALPLSIPSANPSTALVPNRFGIDVPWKAFWRGANPKTGQKVAVLGLTDHRVHSERGKSQNDLEQLLSTALNCSQQLSAAPAIQACPPFVQDIASICTKREEGSVSSSVSGLNLFHSRPFKVSGFFATAPLEQMSCR